MPVCVVIGYYKWPTFQRACVCQTIPCNCRLSAVLMYVCVCSCHKCAFVACTAVHACVLCERNVRLRQQKRWGGKKQSIKLLPWPCYQGDTDSINEPRSLFPWKHLWMRKGPGNPGDSVNEELPHRSNPVMEDAFQKLRCHHIFITIIISVIKVITGLSHIKDIITLQLNRKSLWTNVVVLFLI